MVKNPALQNLQTPTRVPQLSKMSAQSTQQLLVKPPPYGEDTEMPMPMVSIPRDLDNLGLLGASAASSSAPPVYQVRKVLHHGTMKLADIGISILMAHRPKCGLFWLRRGSSLIFLPTELGGMSTSRAPRRTKQVVPWMPVAGCDLSVYIARKTLDAPKSSNDT